MRQKKVKPADYVVLGTRTRLTPAEKAWLGLGTYILAADIYLWRTENDTMSIQFENWVQSKQGRVLCFLATAGIIAHLWYGLPLPLQTKAKRILGGQKPL